MFDDMKKEIIKIFDLVPVLNTFISTLSNGQQVWLVKNSEEKFEGCFNILEKEIVNLKMTND